MRKYLILILVAIGCFSESCAKKSTETIVRFETTYGNITVKLYPETTKHRSNFLKLVNDGFYNGVLFHRVIENFMIQGGDPKSKTATPEAYLGSGDVGYTIPAEFIYPKYYHKRGALAAARENDQINPIKASSGCQFYIVQGKTFSDEKLDSIDQRKYQKAEERLFQDITEKKQNEIKILIKEKKNSKIQALSDSILKVVHEQLKLHPTYKLTPQQRTDYKTIGGTPHLDGSYTVFGEVIEGLEIVESISKVKTNDNNRPLEDIKVIKAEVIN